MAEKLTVTEIYEMVRVPDTVPRSEQTIEYDDDGLLYFIDPRSRALYIGVRTSPVAADGTADMVLFQAWNKEVKRDPPTMKPTKTWYEEQTHVTWARIFVEADQQFTKTKGLRPHIKSQMEYCDELDDDRYCELNPRRVGRYVDDGPWGDDISEDWIEDKLNG